MRANELASWILEHCLLRTSSSSMEVRIWIARSFGDLAELQWCGLRRNELTALPDSFGNLAALEVLLLNSPPARVFAVARISGAIR